MSELIWVGNHLFPRDIVFLAIGVIALAVISAFVVVTRR